MKEIKEMTIFEKILAMRERIANSVIKKSGYNGFSNFDYFELVDIVPIISKLAIEYNVFLKTDIKKETASLTAMNLDKKDDNTTANIFVPDLEDRKGTQRIQQVGGYVTYFRRYLYLLLFDIIESDSIDNIDNRQKKKGKKKRGIKKKKEVKRNFDVILCVDNMIRRLKANNEECNKENIIKEVKKEKNKGNIIYGEYEAILKELEKRKIK